MKWCRARGRRFADSLSQGAHTGEGITDRNQLAAFTQHVRFHASQRQFSPLEQLRHKVRRPINQFFYRLADIRLMIESTNGCFLKRFHHDGLRLVRETVTVPAKPPNIAAIG